MRLLILTQKVDKDDDLLGFFHSWLNELARHFEKVTIICLFEGKHDLPANVKVLSLGKEKGESKLKYIYNFFRYVFSERKNYDSVFVHMNQIYVLLGGIFWRIWGKKVALWYVHRQKSFSLWLAEKLVNVVFTSVPESFSLKSKKVQYVGHGVDTEFFSCFNRNNAFNKPIRIIAVGRITPIKNLDILIEALSILNSKGFGLRAEIVGAPALKSDQAYLNEIKQIVQEKGLEGKVSFVGSVSNKDLPKYYCESDILVNLSPRGGVDKVVLEGMAGGVIPIVSNTAFREVLGEYVHNLVFKERDVSDLVLKIEGLLAIEDVVHIREYLVKKVQTSYDTKIVIEKIVKIICVQ